jgi:hypothetical protein
MDLVERLSNPQADPRVEIAARTRSLAGTRPESRVARHDGVRSLAGYDQLMGQSTSGRAPSPTTRTYARLGNAREPSKQLLMETVGIEPTSAGVVEKRLRA